MRFIFAFFVTTSLVVTGCETFSDSDAQNAQLSVKFEVVTPSANAGSHPGFAIPPWLVALHHRP